MKSEHLTSSDRIYIENELEKGYYLNALWLFYVKIQLPYLRKFVSIVFLTGITRGYPTMPKTFASTVIIAKNECL